MQFDFVGLWSFYFYRQLVFIYSNAFVVSDLWHV